MAPVARDDAGDEERPGEGPDLVERLVHAEATAAPDGRGDVGEQGGLRRAAHGLARALEQDEDRGEDETRTADERA